MSGSQQTVRSLVINSSIESDIYAAGDVDISQGSVVWGNVYARGTLTLDRSARVRGSAYAAGDIQLSRYSRIEGDARAGHNISVDETSVIMGNSVKGYNGPWLLPPTLEHEMSEACQKMETRELFDRAALEGEDYLRGYLGGWADGMEMFLKYAPIDMTDTPEDGGD